MQSLREQFVKSYGNKELEALNQTLLDFAAQLREHIAKIAETESAKDPAKDKPHDGAVMISKISGHIDLSRVMQLDGYLELHKVCAQADVDTMVFFSEHGKKNKVGFRDYEGHHYTVNIHIATPYAQSPQREAVAKIRRERANVVGMGKPPQSTPGAQAA